MVILGLGANVGDRLANLRKAYAAIKQLSEISILQISPIYLSDALLPPNAPADWDQPYLNLAIRCETTFSPNELLIHLKKIEASIGRKPEVRHWGPRVIDIDILVFEQLIVNDERLTLPHPDLLARPFVLWPLADVAPFWRYPLEGAHLDLTAAQLVEPWGSRYAGDAPYHTRQINQRLEKPAFMGIINVTPNSFSDGGRRSKVDDYVQHAQQLVADGAEILDIGAESTNPRAEEITEQEEWQRLEPILAAISANKAQYIIPPKISIDTRRAEVAARALTYAVDWINDVSGLDDMRMRELILAAGKTAIIMHHIKIPERREHVLPRNQDPSWSVLAWGERRIEDLLRAGFNIDNLIFDPGIGFGKMAEQSLAIIKNISIFKSLGTKLLVGHARKTFLSLFSQEPFAERDLETSTISNYLAAHSIDYLRVHNPRSCLRMLKVQDVLSAG